ncbi:MAG: transposase [Gemmatimonadota bacterium]
MLQWPHSGFHVHTGVGVGAEDRPCALRLARYCARNPLALGRLTYDPATEQLTYRSDTADGPTAGTQALDPLEFLARLLTHIPDPGQVMTRYYGWYASRTRGMRRRQAAGGVAAEEPVAITDPADWSLRAARYRWAELLRRIFEVEPLTCPRCSALMRIVAVITDPRPP